MTTGRILNIKKPIPLNSFYIIKSLTQNYQSEIKRTFYRWTWERRGSLSGRMLCGLSGRWGAWPPPGDRQDPDIVHWGRQCVSTWAEACHAAAVSSHCACASTCAIPTGRACSPATRTPGIGGSCDHWNQNTGFPKIKCQTSFRTVLGLWNLTSEYPDIF